MVKNRYCVIMAGGVGARFWPQSRKTMPKQFLDVLGTGKSFIRSTFERFLPIIPAENFIVVTNRDYKDLVLQHLPELDPKQILCEPIGRNTAPCVAYAAYSLIKRDPEAQMIVTPSDHLILNEAEFQTLVSECIDFTSKNDVLMTIGIQPNRPETGYGYIQKSSAEPISRVKCFTEKPNAELAQAFVECGEFLWNSGIFIWSAQTIIEAFKKYLPEHHTLFSGAMLYLGTKNEEDAIRQVFSECKAISIDYGIMEKADNVYVRCGDFGWSDVGTWGSVYKLSARDKNENVVMADACYAYSTERTFISLPKGKVAVVNGLKDYIIVDTEDALLICPRSEEQSIKNYIDDVRFDTGEKYI